MNEPSTTKFSNGAGNFSVTCRQRAKIVLNNIKLLFLIRYIAVILRYTSCSARFTHPTTQELSNESADK